MELRPLERGERGWVERFMVERWGATIVTGRGRSWSPAELPGFAAFDGETLVGLLTYELEGETCEIVTIDAVVERRGVGSALLEAVEQLARSKGCRVVQLVTTNNNLGALAFYQKRGFRLVGLLPGAIEEARKLKPEIPAVDSAGLPIRDELYLELLLA